MKIFNNNKCYIQVDDMMYLLRNECMDFPMDLYYDIINRYGSNIPVSSFVEIINEDHINYIKNSKRIFDFNFLNSKSIEDLDELCDQIIFESNRKKSIMVLKGLKYRNAEGAKMQNNPFVRLDISHERENRRYLLNQVKEIIYFKKGEPRLKYPFDEQSMQLIKK